MTKLIASRRDDGNQYTIQPFTFKRLQYSKEHIHPYPRSGHRSIASNHKLWLFGGYNPVEMPQRSSHPLFREAWVYNYWLNSWRKMPNDDLMPHSVASQAVIKHNNFMVTMGGTGYPFGQDKSSNDITVCSLFDEKWTLVETTGEKPDKVYGQAMVRHGRSVLVYGGTSGFEYTSSLHRLDIDTMVWTKIKPNNSVEELPRPRYRHEMVVHDDELFVVGGGTSSEAYQLDTVWVYSITDNRWRLKETMPDPHTNEHPKARRCHSCVKYKSSAYVCGGYDSTRVNDDLWRLHLPTLQWTLLSRMERALYFHSASVTSEGCMYVFGGVSSGGERNNALTRVWLDVPTLRTICLNKLRQTCPDITKWSCKKLAQVGVSPVVVNTFSGGTAGG